MAVIKVFDSVGIKTLVLSGYANEQDYDPLPAEEIDADSDDTESAD